MEGTNIRWIGSINSNHYTIGMLSTVDIFEGTQMLLWCLQRSEIVGGDDFEESGKNTHSIIQWKHFMCEMHICERYSWHQQRSQ